MFVAPLPDFDVEFPGRGVPVSVRFDASPSIDDGEIVRYFWMSLI